MSKYNKLSATVMIKSLKNDLELSIRNLAKKSSLNRAFFVGYLKALENQEDVRLKKIELAKVHFSVKSKRGYKHAK